eukprot:6172870-Pleurochrysis_carterae.AAC.1
MRPFSHSFRLLYYGIYGQLTTVHTCDIHASDGLVALKPLRQHLDALVAKVAICDHTCAPHTSRVCLLRPIRKSTRESLNRIQLAGQQHPRKQTNYRPDDQSEPLHYCKWRSSCETNYGEMICPRCPELHVQTAARDPDNCHQRFSLTNANVSWK